MTNIFCFIASSVLTLCRHGFKCLRHKKKQFFQHLVSGQYICFELITEILVHVSKKFISCRPIFLSTKNFLKSKQNSGIDFSLRTLHRKSSVVLTFFPLYSQFLKGADKYLFFHY